MKRAQLFSSGCINSYHPIDDLYYIGAKNSSEEEDIKLYINHSCNPNCGLRGEITFVAIRDIKVSDELTIDYAFLDNEDYSFDCSCSEICCRKIVTGRDWKLKCIQEKYLDNFATYLKNKIIIGCDNRNDQPFILWASDRECNIKLWAGQSENMYGYSHDDVIGKDFVKLFVAPNEQNTARHDQLRIIDDNAVIKMKVNDLTRTGNTIPLKIICQRIMDPISSEFWNVETGYLIDYLDKNIKRLELIVQERQKVNMYIAQFTETANQKKTQYQARNNAIRSAIVDEKTRAATTNRLTIYKEKIIPLTNTIDGLQCNLNVIIKDYFQKIQECSDVFSCKQTMLEFDEEYDKMVYNLEDVFIRFKEINSEYDGYFNTFHIRDDLLKFNFDLSRRLDNLIFELLTKAEDDINEYKNLGIHHESKKLNALKQRLNGIRTLRETLLRVTNEYTDETMQSTDNDQLLRLRNLIKVEYSHIENTIMRYKKDIEVIY